MKKHININGDHAKVRTLTYREKKVLLPHTAGQVVERKAVPITFNPAYSRAMTLAWLLFPKNFPTQLASARTNRLKTYSNQINLNRESQQIIENYYKRRRFDRQTEHSAKTAAIAEKANQTLFEAGIDVNGNSMNYGLHKKTPVFFEVTKLHFGPLTNYINSLPERTPAQSLRKKQAKALLHSLQEANLDSDGVVWCHSGFI